jgi:toxin ParE1/3/4
VKTSLLLIRPEAEADLTDAYRWYEERNRGLGVEFLRSVEASLFSLQKNPEAYLKIHKNIRRALIRRFPYGIFYVFEQKTIVILAVFHVRRNPKLLKARIP